jgi:hypothetical protein
VHDIWRAGAPMIDVFSPDIYLPDFKGITAMYHHSWNPLFIPESFADTVGAANVYYAIGKYNAIGYSPFGIDGERAPANPFNAILPKTYKVLSGMAPVILDAQSKGNMTAVILNKDNPVEKITMGGYHIEINLRRTRYGASPQTAGFASVYEGIYENGVWKPGRKLNGDNIMLSYKLADEAAVNQTGSVARFESANPEVLKVKLYRFE